MILQEFIARLNTVLAAAAGLAGLPVRRGSAGKQFSYEELQAANTNFVNAARAAMAADHTEFETLKNSMKVAPGFTLFGMGLELLQSHFDAAMDRTRTALKAFDDACDQHLGRWKGVPGELEGQGERWDGLAARVSARSNQAQEWRTVPGWAGASANEYAAAAQVQANALRELAGMMSTAASSCRAAAALNMVAFSEVAQITRDKTNEIQGLMGFSLGLPYRRTERAAQCCVQLTQMLAAVFPMTNNLADPLRGAVTTTMNSGNLLVPGSWPSGTDRAAVAPAVTDGAVNEAQYYAQIRG